MSAFHRNILIEDNYIRSVHVYGITVWHVDGLTIRENTLVHNPDLGLYSMSPLINVSTYSKNVRIVDNVAPSVPVPQNSTWTVSGNTTDGDKYMHHYGPISTSSSSSLLLAAEDAPVDSDGTATAPDDVREVESRLEYEVDVFRIKERGLEGDVRFVVADLDFGDGDVLVLRDFAPGTFVRKSGGNPVNVWDEGRSVRIDDALDIHELAAMSSRVTATVRADDAVALAVAYDGGVAEVLIEGLGAAFRAADQPDLF